MMTQSVKTQATNLFAGASGSVTLKGKQTGSDFSLFIGNSLKSAARSTDNADTKMIQKKSAVSDTTKNNMKSDNSDSDSKQADKVQSDDPGKPEATKVTDQTTTDTQSDSTKAAQTKDTDTDNTKETPVDEQLMAQIEAMLQSIQQAVMDKLNLSPEEFNQLMTKQGFSLADLLQPENLQQLILSNGGNTDITAALTDENLADMLKQLMQTVEDIKQDSKLNLSADQIKSLIEQAKIQADARTGTEPLKDVTGKDEQTEVSQEPVNETKSKITANAADNNTDKKVAKADTGVNTQTEKPVTKTDTASSSDSNSKSDKELASDKFQTFVDNLVKPLQNLQTNFSGQMDQAAKLREIANQIIERIKISVTKDQTSMELQLNPENLGKVNLSVQSKEGVMTAHFVVQNELSKEAIESQLQSLRDTLHQQGVKVEAIEVTVSANAFEQNKNQSSENGSETKESNSGKKITLEDALNMTEASEENQSLEELSGISGSVINYTA